MKIDMSYIKSLKSTHRFAIAIATLLTLGLTGCEGGLIGTGSGPSDLAYELENLPDRISPDIPKTLSNGGVSRSADKQKEIGPTASNRHNFPTVSRGWGELNSELTDVATGRFYIRTYSTIVDLVFDDILNECAEQLLNCTIPADRIRVTITQDVVNRLKLIQSDWENGISAVWLDHIDIDSSDLSTPSLESLLDKELVFGETHYAQLDGAPFSHHIRTTITSDAIEYDPFVQGYQARLFGDTQTFTARWHEDDQVAKYNFDEPFSPSWEYFYQNNVPSELVVNHYTHVADYDGTYVGTYTRILGNDPSEAGVLVDAANVTYSYTNTVFVDDSVDTESGGQSSVALPEQGEGGSNEIQQNQFADQVYRVLRGQVDNSGGYSLLDERHFELPEQQNRVYFLGYRDAYDTQGRLLAGERCRIDERFPDFFFEDSSDCNENMFVSYGPEGSQITDSPHYFADHEFDSLAALQDAVRWKVEGIPGARLSIAVIPAASQTDLPNAEVLCRGIQYMTDDAHIFCTATDEQLDNTAVVELVDGVPSRLIPEAKLVQIQ